MLSDLRLTLRQLWKTPGFTLVALVTLALGIGVNTSMFSVLNTLLLHEPAYPETARLMRVFRAGPTFNEAPHSPANFLDLRTQVKSFSHLAAYTEDLFNLAEPGQRALSVTGMAVSADFFPLLGVQPALGRFLTADDDRPGHNDVVVLSDTIWRRHFAADPQIVGKPIRLDGTSVTVLGVMPAGFDDRLVWGPAGIWRPLALSDEARTNRGGNWLSLIGRLQPGVTREAASAEISVVATQLAAAYPKTNARSTLSLMPFVRSTQDPTGRMVALFAMGLAACVLLIACANLANLLFARNVARSREHAIRAALGASYRRLLRQSLTESLVLALGGGGLGILLAVWCNALLGARLRIAGEAGLTLPLDWRVAGFALVVATLSAVGFGLLPAILAARTDVNEALKQGTRGSTSGAHHRVRHSLIVTEMALALVLLAGAGFFLRGLDRFLKQDVGWQTHGLLTANVNLPRARYPDDAAKIAFYDRLLQRTGTLPGVESTGIALSLPFDDFNFSQRFIVEGKPVPDPGSEPMRFVNNVNPAYFETMGVVLLEGRLLTAADLTGPVKTVISESMAKKYWPGESALGKRIRHPSAEEWQEVIGVVRDVKFATNLQQAQTSAQTYRLLAREPNGYLLLAWRTTAPADSLLEPLRRAIAEIDPELPLNNLQCADGVIADKLTNFAVIGWLLSGFALLGLLLAAVGIYGVISGFVAERTTEIGIRMALGAQVSDVLGMVLRQGLRLALIGLIIGLAGAWGVARLLASFAPALPPAGIATVLAVAAALLTVAAFACWLPARRASRVDPMVALRAD